MNTIKSTLLNSLFLKPSPINKIGFLNAQDILFPLKQDFIEFLETESSQLLKEKAFNIINNLIYSSSCSPPRRLISNLMLFESDERSKPNGGDFIPKDHICHLVHLYLLGIYIFSYQENIYRRCVTVFRKYLRSIKNRKNIDSLSEYDIFASFWKSFVLFHDIGYPLERIYPKNRDSDSMFLKPFKKIEEAILNDIAVEIITKTVVVATLIDEENHNSFEDMFIDHLPEVNIIGADVSFSSDLINEIGEDRSKIVIGTLTKFRKAKYLANVTGGEDLSYIISLLPKMDIIAILEEPSGESYLFIVGNSSGCMLYDDFLFASKDKATKKWITDINNKENIFYSGLMTKKKYKWHFFANNPRDCYDIVLKDIFHANVDGFNLIYSHIREQKIYRSIKTCGYDNAQTLGLVIYRILNDLVDETYLNLSADSKINQNNFKFEFALNSNKNLIMSLKNIFKEVIEKMIDEDINENNKMYKDNFNSNGSESLAEILLKSMNKNANKKITKRRLVESIKTHISEPIRIHDSANKLIYHLIDYHKSASTSETDKTSVLNDSIEISKVELETFNDILKKCGIIDLDDVIKHYLPDWVKNDDNYTNEDFIDHGIASSIVALVTADTYFSLIERAKNSNNLFLKLAFSNLNARSNAIMELSIKGIKNLIAKTIFIHNLYPEYFMDFRKKYRTDLSAQPFSFLSILSDSLQKWDRELLVKEVGKNSSNFMPGNHYDIKISKLSKIDIKYSFHGIDFSKMEYDLKLILKEFLKDADAIINLDLREC